jgi:hypothetical protein
MIWVKITDTSDTDIALKNTNNTLNDLLGDTDTLTTTGYYTIEKQFTIIKEYGKWKVLEYTSVLQFSDKELK